LRLSGVDPGIIRELSGIYKPFVKAFKELVSNAYDADANQITVRVSDAYNAIEIEDDGIGMTPFQFQRDFARIGGSTAWLSGGKSPGGRDRIGYKGIGFLAVARYCTQLRIVTRSESPYLGRHIFHRRNRKKLPLKEMLGEEFDLRQFKDRLGVVRVEALDEADAGQILQVGYDYTLDGWDLRLRSHRALRSARFCVDYQVDCSDLELRATMDFDYLLGLERRCDLRELENFCTIELAQASSTPPGTRVTLHALKDFVVRELSAPRLKGKAKNLASRSGRERFEWELARSSPVCDDIPDGVSSSVLRFASRRQRRAGLPTLKIHWGREEPRVLRRPVYIPKELDSIDSTAISVDIREGGLHAVGYILARSHVIYPAEFRGIAIRVRNVAIGDPSFLGWETIMSGPRKAAMSQITGEISVLSGIDAADAINPGRESFYEENVHFRILKTRLFGSEETVSGLVGEAVRAILSRIHVRSLVTDKLSAAKQRRKTLRDISSAVNFYVNSGGAAADALQGFFSQTVRANDLCDSRTIRMGPGHRLGAFEVQTADGLGSEFEIDHENKRILLDLTQDSWSNSIYLNGHYYEVVFKQGKPDHPVCEFDNLARKIYVNWAHPVKLHMDDPGFLKSSILLRLSCHASPSDANAMMELALRMLAFRAE
jgi:hypothetical protein